MSGSAAGTGGFAYGGAGGSGGSGGGPKGVGFTTSASSRSAGLGPLFTETSPWVVLGVLAGKGARRWVVAAARPR